MLAKTLLLIVLAASETDPRRVLRESFEREVRQLVEGVDGVLGVAVSDPATGEGFSIHGGMVFAQASAIKLPLLVELMRQVDEGKHRLEEILVLQSEDVVPGSGVLQQLTPGKTSLSLLDVATLMITVSDNTATNVIIDRVGMANVNATMDKLGLASTKLARKMQDRTAWTENRENVSTPDDQARLLALLHRGEILSPDSRKTVLRILSIPKPGPIRKLLPDGTEVAHKTGSLPGVVVDVGIVHLPDQPFVVAAMGSWLADSEEAERAIAEISLRAFRYYDRLAHSNAFGHRK